MNLAERQRAERRRAFIGRDDELAIVRAMLTTTPPVPQVLYVHGPGGIGKSALLDRAGALFADHGADVRRVDARTLDDDLSAAESRLRTAVGPGEAVLLIDHVEALAGLESWLRDVLLPTFPATTRVVLASREPPSVAWRALPGWGTLIVDVGLRNLPAADASALLASRGVRDEQRQAVLDFTHGHPLALCLAAEVALRPSRAPFSAASSPDVVRALLRHLVDDVSDDRQRAALEVCALACVTDEAVLTELVGDGRDAFEWLAGRSFVTAVDGGLVPHDLVRELVAYELRWRDAARYQALMGRLFAHVIRRLERDTEDRARAFRDLFFAFRSMLPRLDAEEWNRDRPVWTTAAEPRDVDVLVEIVRRHEGDDSAAIAAHWLRRPAATTVVARGASREPVGFATWLSLGQVTAEDRRRDPALKPAFDHLRAHAPLRDGEDAEYLRFQMASATYQGLSPHYFWLSARMFERNFARKAAFSFFAMAEPALHEPVFAMQGTARIAAADFQIGDRTYGVFGHDWRRTPYEAWLELAQRSLVLGGPAPPAEPLVVLSQPDFADEVGAALRALTDRSRLSASPLLRSRLVETRAGRGASPDARVDAMIAVIRDAVETISASAKTAHLAPVLRLTYLDPLPKQHAVAHELGLPFSTYRLHLTTAIDRVVALLWDLEIGR